jgi:Ni/Co efflux regulator RcnB
MRKLAFALLLASATVPTFAAAQERDEESSEPRAESSERPQPRSERRQPRSERQERPQVRSARPERSFDIGSSASDDRSLIAPSRDRPAVQDRPEPAAEPSERRPFIERVRDMSSRGRRGDVERRGPAVTPIADDPAEVAPTGDSVRDWRARDRRRPDSPTIEERHVRRPPLIDRSGEDLAQPTSPAVISGDGDGLVQPTRPLPRVLDPNRRRVSRTPLPGTEPPPPETATAVVAEPRHRWRGDWRRDRRFDWRDHRRRHRSLFRLGFYFDPFGWRYHRYGIGWRLWPSYYSSRYWLHDPWMYRLPPAYGPYRWVRYYDDALLVNIYTGRVVDVIHNFFW